VIALGDEHPEDALAWFRAAAAMEEARAALFGTSIRSAGAPTLTAGGVALGMSLNNRLGKLALAQNHPEVAIEAFARNIGLENASPKPISSRPSLPQCSPMKIPATSPPSPKPRFPSRFSCWPTKAPAKRSSSSAKKKTLLPNSKSQ